MQGLRTHHTTTVYTHRLRLTILTPNVVQAVKKVAARTFDLSEYIVDISKKEVRPPEASTVMGLT